MYLQVDLHVIYIIIMSNAKMETDTTPRYDMLYRMSNNAHITLYLCIIYCAIVIGRLALTCDIICWE